MHAFAHMRAQMCLFALQIWRSDVEPQILYQPSVGLWFCRLVELSELSTEDFHLIMHPKQIHLAPERREVICKIKHVHAQIVISYPFR